MAQPVPQLSLPLSALIVQGLRAMQRLTQLETPISGFKMAKTKAKTEAKHCIKSDDDLDNKGSKIMSQPVKPKGGNWDKAAMKTCLVPKVILCSTLTTPAPAKPKSQAKCKANDEVKADDPNIKWRTSGQTRKLSSHMVAAAESSESEHKQPKGKANKNCIDDNDEGDEYEDDEDKDETKEDELPKKKTHLPPADEEERVETRTKQSKRDPAPSSSVPEPASDDYRPSTPDGSQVVKSYKMKVRIPAKESIVTRMRQGTKG
ncbi:hypothetical protein FRC11_005938 [Ceratobasidium sp. 423]|nr:hypothetical protein FRC11_005938 [Ceratobasidium sp. 423]